MEDNLLFTMDKCESFMRDFIPFLKTVGKTPNWLFGKIINGQKDEVLIYILMFLLSVNINLFVYDNSMTIYMVFGDSSAYDIHKVKDKPMINMIEECIIKAMYYYDQPF